MSFFRAEYRNLILDLQSAGVETGGVADFLASKEKHRFAILRHDVDRRPQSAVKMAQLESSLGIKSTYYFRASETGKFPVDSILAIEEMGHEVGYHFEELSRAGGEIDQAVQRFLLNLDAFRKVAPCRTISMHGAPLSGVNNQDLVRHLNLNAIGILADAVEGVQSHSPYYLTDTGGGWSANSSNLRDRLGVSWPCHAFPHCREVFRNFVMNARAPVYISTHPERWADTRMEFLFVWIKDKLVNLAKIFLKFTREGHAS